MSKVSNIWSVAALIVYPGDRRKHLHSYCVKAENEQEAEGKALAVYRKLYPPSAGFQHFVKIGPEPILDSGELLDSGEIIGPVRLNWNAVTNKIETSILIVDGHCYEDITEVPDSKQKIPRKYHPHAGLTQSEIELMERT